MACLCRVFAWCMLCRACRIFLLLRVVHCTCKYGVQHTKTKINDTTPNVQHVMHTKQQKYTRDSTPNSRVGCMSCSGYMLCGLFVVFKNTLIRAIILLFVVTTSMFIALLALYFVVATSVLIDVSIWHFSFFCVCVRWRGTSMLNSVLKIYFHVPVRIAFACCSVASNILIGFLTLHFVVDMPCCAFGVVSCTFVVVTTCACHSPRATRL